MTKQEINELKTDTRVSVFKYDVGYAEKAYERMLEMNDFVANNLRHSYQTLVEELGEEKAREMLEQEEPGVVDRMIAIADKWEATLKILELAKALQNIKL